MLAGSSTELQYILVLLALFVVPKILQRWRIPAAATSLMLGATSSIGFSLFVHDSTIDLLSVFGIVALFLFAGLDIDFSEVKREGKVIVYHLALFGATLLGVALLSSLIFDVGLRIGLLISLAIITPSTGFILSSLETADISENEKFWIRSTAIATELVALAALFVSLQSESTHLFVLSTVIIGVMIFILPLLFNLFTKWIVPSAPNSEFAFLLMVALICAYVTRQLGVYYLVGAFIVGVTAQRMYHSIPALSSDKMLHAVEIFSSFFVPFYFFHAGLKLERSDFGADAIIFGLATFLSMTPLRLILLVAIRKILLKEISYASLRIGLRLIPTLVFSLVVASIVKAVPSAPSFLFGGIVIYALLNTILPGLVFKISPPVYEQPKILE